MTTPAAPADILGESRPLAKVFSSDYVFSIPTYQRPYAWTTEETEELLDDVLAFADRDPDRDASQVHALPPYFLGSVVLIKAPNDPRADVVDGQQRLTTLSVLFAALRELADLGERQEFDPFVREAGSTVRGTKAQPRLTLRDRDQPFFARHVQAPGALAGIADAKTENDAQENLRDNAALLYRRLAEMEPARRTRLGAYLAQRCYLVVVSTRDRPSAYRIFSVLNDRGLDLSAADILKADTIGALATDPDAEAEFTRRWEDTEETLGRDRFLELFGHIRTVHQKVKRKEALLDEVQKYVRPSERPRAFIEDELEPYADVLLQAREATFGNRTDPDPSVAAVNRALRHLGDVDNADWVPVALVLLRHHAADPERLAQALGLLDRLASAMMVYRGNVNTRMERYAEALTHLEGDHDDGQPSWNGDPLSPDSPLHLRDDEHARVLDRLDGDLYEEKRTRKFVLLRLDEALSEGTATYDHGTVSVEHVLPQTPPAGSEWTRQFDGEATRRAYLHKLGNLVLLSRSRNSKARNLPFAEKKAKYFSADGGGSPFVLTSGVLKEPDWTPDVVERRQADLLSALARHWRLDLARWRDGAGNTDDDQALDTSVLAYLARSWAAYPGPLRETERASAGLRRRRTPRPAITHLLRPRRRRARRRRQGATGHLHRRGPPQRRPQLGRPPRRVHPRRARHRPPRCRRPRTPPPLGRGPRRRRTAPRHELHPRRLMPVDTSEDRFERDIVERLTAPLTGAGGVADPPVPYGAAPSGYLLRTSADYDRARCLLPADAVAFVQATQPEQWNRLRRATEDPEAVFLKELGRVATKRGTLSVLRDGFKVPRRRLPHGLLPTGHRPQPGPRPAVPGQPVRRGPAAPVQPDLGRRARPRALPQRPPDLHRRAQNAAQRADLAQRRPPVPAGPRPRRAALRARPLPRSLGRRPRRGPLHHAPPREPTRFFPFNRGFDGGAGNPPSASGYATAYLWTETWARDSVLDLVQHVVHQIDVLDDDGEPTGEQALVFPRYHQLDAVRRLVADTRAHGPGKRYLVQHSAGSGKSFTIGWLAHRLTSLHDADDRRVFDAVIVVTDRRILDKQLGQTIGQLERTRGLVATVADSRELRQAIEDGKQIVVSTIQKFPEISDAIAADAGRRYAVLVDEAHSSQSGDLRRHLNTVLEAGSLDEAARKDEQTGDDLEDTIAQGDVHARAPPQRQHLRVHGHAQTDHPRALRHPRRRRPLPTRSASTRCGRPSTRGSSRTSSRTTSRTSTTSPS